MSKNAQYLQARASKVLDRLTDKRITPVCQVQVDSFTDEEIDAAVNKAFSAATSESSDE